MKEFFDVLFDHGEGYCTGDAYGSRVYHYPKYGEFFCINPLDLKRDYGWSKKPDVYDANTARRADINVTCFRNLMFEMDDVPLDTQLEIFTNSKIPFTSIVYSGGKSLHAILSVEGGICEGNHTQEGLIEYKQIWERLAAQLNRETAKLLGKTADYIDSSCRNASRLSRYPGFKAKKREVQRLFVLTERMHKEDFLDLLEDCPVVMKMEVHTFETPVDEVCNIEEFEALAPAGLIRSLKYASWANESNNYNEMLKLCFWAIDTTNVNYDTFIEFLDKYTFKIFDAVGYPEHKRLVAVDHAFREKRKIL